jgi:hypothetical protein
VTWIFNIIGVAFAIWFLLQLKRMLFSGVPPGSYGHWDGNGEFAFEIVGESHYQKALELAAGGRAPESVRVRKRAMLVPEPDNPHDENAVRVDIDYRRVGYLSREDAIEYNRRLFKKGLAGKAMTVDAIIVGGWDRGDGARGHFGVRLDLPVY